MDIVIVSQYLRNIENFEGNNSRFVYLAKLLEGKHHDVEIVTSDFMHSPKTHAQKVGSLGTIKITALHEIGYSRNVCLKRFRSHKQLAKNIRNYLTERKKPDLIYAAIPSLDVAEAAAEYCRENGVRFVVDIQDLWPEAFKMVLRVPVVSDIVFKPMEKQANKIYAEADEIVAVSKTYAERGMSANKKCKLPIVACLGTDKEEFDSYSEGSAVKAEGITIAYIGSMAESYDLISVIDAIAKLDIDTPVKLLAMGEGTLRNSFIEYANKKGINAEFTGRLPYPQMVERLVLCDIAVNPIRKGSAGSVINKVGDYAMAGLPVVNTQECEEYRDLLNQYGAGINCECENSDEITEALERLISDDGLRCQMAQNSRKLGTEYFDRNNAYQKLVNGLLMNMEQPLNRFCDKEN